MNIHISLRLDLNLFTLMSLMSCPNKCFGKLFHSLIILTKKEYLKALIRLDLKRMVSSSAFASTTLEIIVKV